MVNKIYSPELDDLEIIKQLLQRAKIKMTLQRVSIIKILLHAKSAMTALEIEKQSLEQKTHVQLTTVYSTLKLLLQAGIVQRFYLNSEKSFFSLKKLDQSNMTVCRVCGEKKTVYLKDIDDILKAFCQENLLDFESYELVLTVKCKVCT